MYSRCSLCVCSECSVYIVYEGRVGQGRAEHGSLWQGRERGEGRRAGEGGGGYLGIM